MNKTVNQSRIEGLGSTQESQHLKAQDFKENKKLNWAVIKEVLLPFRQIPDICSIQVKTTDQDSLFETFGIKKSKSKAKLDIIPWNNKKYNRYLCFRLLYMRGLKDKQYWDQVKQLSQTSNVIWITTLRAIMPDWHRQYPYWYVKSQLKKAKLIAKAELMPMASARIYIPKPDGRSRPLGVPEMRWRLYLNMINNFLVMRLKEKVNVNQHGFIPGRGTMTAWKVILEEVINAKDIYEIDLKNAFNSISTKHITKTLSGHGLPKWLVSQLVLNSVSPTIFKEHKTQQSEESTEEYLKRILQGSSTNKAIHSEEDFSNSGWYMFWQKIIPLCQNLGMTGVSIYRLIVKGAGNYWVKNKKYYKELEEKRINKVKPILDFDTSLEDKYNFYSGENQEDTDPNLSAWMRILGTTHKISTKEQRPEGKALKDQLKSEILRAVRYYKRDYAGVAQGSPVSPFIFALCVDDYFFKKIAKKGIKCIAYADDAIFYGDISNEKDIIKDSPETGLEINRKKSGWVKRNFDWEKGLKFLGMTYSVTDKQVKWYSSTRSGRELLFDKELLLDLVHHRKAKSESAMMIPSNLNELEEMNRKIADLELKIQSRQELIEKLEDIGMKESELIDEGTASFPVKRLELTMLGLARGLKKQEEKEKQELKEWTELNGLDLSTKLSRTGLMGFIQSRMYIGTWTYDIKQDFRMTYKEGSWIDIQKKKGLRANIFNASSFGYGDLLNALRRKTSQLPREVNHKKTSGQLKHNFFTQPRLVRVKTYRVKPV